MTQRNDTDTGTFRAGEELQPDRLVKITSAGTVFYADANEEWHGVSRTFTEISTLAGVVFRNKVGTIVLTASAAILRGASVYVAADGKISSTPSGPRVGIALEAASANNSKIEVYLVEDDGVATFTAGEALAVNRLVKLHTDGTLLYADAGEEAIGVTLAAADSAASVAIRLSGALTRFTGVASEAIAVGSVVFTAADGKVADTASATRIGVAQSAAAADGDAITVIYQPGIPVPA